MSTGRAGSSPAIRTKWREFEPLHSVLLQWVAGGGRIRTKRKEPRVMSLGSFLRLYLFGVLQTNPPGAGFQLAPFGGRILQHDGVDTRLDEALGGIACSGEIGRASCRERV